MVNLEEKRGMLALAAYPRIRVSRPEVNHNVVEPLQRRHKSYQDRKPIFLVVQFAKIYLKKNGPSDVKGQCVTDRLLKYRLFQRV